MAPPFRPHQEMRFGVVLYGGVSLAIYINGVVQELLHLVRATAPASPTAANPTEALLGPGQLTSTEGVYRELGQLVGRSESSAVAPSPDDPILTRFIVDMLSGSSAGGINGVFLAKALANGQPVDQLKNLWVDEGDIAELLNDDRSVVGLNLALREPPKSLLNGQRMYRKLLDALDAMETGRPSTAGRASPLVDELDLWVTTTDLEGLTLPIRLYDKVVYEKRHRNVLHFTYATEQATGGALDNQFLAANNPILAFAARATSAFPFAFEPMTLEDIDEVLDTIPGHQKDPAKRASRPNWDKWFADYAGQNDPYPRRSFGDGGDMDNKPFSYVIDALPNRRWTVPVNRKVIFVEPDPGHPERLATDYERPTVLASVVKALSLGRTETIREDLNRLLDRTRLAEQVGKVAEAAEGSFDVSRPRSPAADDVSLSAYWRLRVLRLADDLGTVLARLRGIDEASGRAEAVRLLVAAWPEPATRGRAGDTERNAANMAFLERFDMAFRLRRLNFVSRKADRLFALDSDALAQLGLPDEPGGLSAQMADDIRSALLDAKRGLNDAYVMMAGAGRAMRAGRVDIELARAIAGLSLDPDDLDAVLVGPPSERVLYRIDYRLAGAAADRSVDFGHEPAGEGRNPRVYDGLGITVSDHVEQGPAMTAAVVTWHERCGLGCGERADIVLPSPATSVRIAVAYFAEPPVVTAGGEGVEVTSAPVAWAPRALVATVTGSAISTVSITGPAIVTRRREPRAERALRLVQSPAFREPFDELAEYVGDLVAAAVSEARTTVQATFATEGVSTVEAGVRSVLARYYERYEDYDRLTLPLVAAAGGGEMVPVDVIRISPDDATSLIDTSTGRRKVAGSAVHHFGGFLDAAWRRNDIMWGRLDAAERLITAVLPESHPRRAFLIESAHRAIISEELQGSPELAAAITAALLENGGEAGKGVAGAAAREPGRVKALVEEAVRSGMEPEKLRAYLRDDFQVPEDLEATSSLRTLARGTRVTGQVLSGLAGEQKLLTRPAALMIRAGTFLWGLVEVSVPRSLPALLFRYWLSLLTLVEIILIVGGALLGQPGAQRLGWTALLLTVAARLTVAVVAGWLRGKKRPLRLAAGAILAAVLGLAFVEAAFHLNDDIQEQLCRTPGAVQRLTSVECPP